MAKLDWFKLSPADWLMGKIQRQPDSVQVAFLRLCCKYWNDLCLMTTESAADEVGEEELQKLIKAKIIKTESGNVKIGFLDKQLGGVEEAAEAKRNAAKERWRKKRDAEDSMHVHAETMHVHAEPMHVHDSAGKTMHVHDSALHNDAEEIREEEIREDKSVLGTHTQAKFSFPGKPQSSDIPDPPAHILSSVAENQYRVNTILIKPEDILGAWKTWAAVHITGTKFYPDVGEVYKHFYNYHQARKIVAVPKADPKNEQQSHLPQANQSAIARKYG